MLQKKPLPAMTRNKSKNKKHNSHKNDKNLYEKLEKQDKNGQLLSEASSHNYKKNIDHNIITKTYDNFKLIAQKISLVSLKAKTWLHEQTKKLDAIKYKNPIISTRITQEARAFFVKVSKLTAKIHVSNPKSQNIISSKATNTTHYDPDFSNIFPDRDLKVSEFSIDNNNIPFIQHIPESPVFHYRPNQKKFDSDKRFQKLMLLDVKPTAKLELELEVLKNKSRKKARYKNKNGYDSISSNQSATFFENKNEHEMNARPVTKCKCNEYLEDVANNLIMLKWINYEQNLGTHNPANFTKIARHILSPNAIGKYVRRKKEIELKCKT